MKRSVAIISGVEERRGAIAHMVRALPFTIAGEIGDIAALRLVALLAPDIVILDAATPALNPIAVLHAQASTPVIAATTIWRRCSINGRCASAESARSSAILRTGTAGMRSRSSRGSSTKPRETERYWRSSW